MFLLLFHFRTMELVELPAVSLAYLEFLQPQTCNYCNKFFTDFDQCLRHRRHHAMKIHRYWKGSYQKAVLESMKNRLARKLILSNERIVVNCAKRLSDSDSKIQHKTKRCAKDLHGQNEEKTQCKAQRFGKNTQRPENMVQYKTKNYENDLQRPIFNTQHKIKSNAKEMQRSKKKYGPYPKTHKCRFCEKCFQWESDKMRHEMIHTLEKPFKCSFCDKTFSIAGHRNSHERTHTKEKPYQCRYCKMSFSHTSSKNRHEMTHKNEKPFECRYCNQSFTRLQHKNRHEKSRCKQRKPVFECQFCNKILSSMAWKNKHEKRCTEKE